MNNLKEKKLNDKGFSLVELIIVIAIMAVLIGVLAPQYLKYVERSRNSTDQDNMAAIESALQVWGAETDLPAGTVAYTNATNTITVTDSAFTISTGGNHDAIEDALDNAGLDTSTRCVSRQAWTQYVITLTVDSAGVVTVSHATS